MKYKIAIHRTEEGISVSVPALPGCWSEGDTEEEALANIQDVWLCWAKAHENRPTYKLDAKETSWRSSVWTTSASW